MADVTDELAGRSVVVTGASTGIGRGTVAELVRRGCQVWPAVRKDADAESLRGEYGDAVRPLVLDVTDADSVLAAGREVAAAGPLHGLVNNAGAALPGPLEYLPIDLFSRQLDINLVGQLRVTQALLPALREGRRDGADVRIVMIGSIGGRVAGPMLGPYHASKFGLVGLTDSLRAELAPFGIRVLLVEPGAIATPIWERGRSAADEMRERLPVEAERYAAQFRAAEQNVARQATGGVPPSVPAKVIVDALTEAHPKPRRTVGRDARLISIAARLLPYRLLYRFVRAAT